MTMDKNNNPSPDDMYPVWTDQEGDIDLTGRMLKNFSYDGSYHSKYYYPQVVNNRIEKREELEHSAACMSLDSDLERKLAEKSKGLLTNSPLSRQAGTTRQKRRPKWFVPSDSSPSQVAESDPDEGGPESCNIHQSTMAAPQHHSGLDPTALELLDAQTSNDSGIARGTKSSESVTSEDSVFSEDYTCDLNEDMLPPKSISAASAAAGRGSEDVDSSFSSNRSSCSSTSTLEAAGNEHGRQGLEDDQHKDKVTDKLPLHSRKKCAQDLNLDIPPADTVLGQDPEIKVMEGSPPGEPSQGSSDGSGENKGAATPDSSTFFYDDGEFEFLKTEPVRRSTSLKTTKTPPGTPSRKKAVRFADALGLDLESVKHILNLDDPPDVPKSAMNDLRVGIEKEQPLAGVKYLSALFSQPGVDPAFIKRVKEGKVVLENCVVNDKDMALSGTVRVANIAFHKHVLVRYTTNNWLTSEDIIASYVHNSNDGASDRFSFTLTVPTYFAVGQRLEFAIMFSANGVEYWDNNYGSNYAIECYAKAAPAFESDNTWMHFL